MEEIQPANSKARVAVLAIVVAGVALGSGALFLTQSQQARLLTWFVQNPSRLELSILGGTVVLILLPIVLFATWTWRFGSRVLAEERFPPQGARVTRDTVIQRGTQARLRGRLFQMLAVMLLAAGGALLFLALHLVLLLRQQH